MKKFAALALALAASMALTACSGQLNQGGSSTSAPAGGGSSGAAQTVYVLGPEPGPGWTAQAGTYAQAKCEEVTKSGQYRAVYMPAASGAEQAKQCGDIIDSGGAAEIVIMPLDDGAKSGQQALHTAGVPFLTFDHIISATEKSSILNAAGDERQCGAGIAFWLQDHGMRPGDTVLVLYGDKSASCAYRQEGFERFLRDEAGYQDQETAGHKTTEVWEQSDLDAIFSGWSASCDWSAKGAYDYLEQELDRITAAARAKNGKLYICSMGDEMTLGVLDYLKSGASPATLAELEALDVYLASIGGMRELYCVLDGSGSQAALAEHYFDGLMSVSLNPKMIQDVIDSGLQFLSGDWSCEPGSWEYQPVWIVDAGNVSQFEGYQGRE